MADSRPRHGHEPVETYSNGEQVKDLAGADLVGFGSGNFNMHGSTSSLTRASSRRFPPGRRLPG